MAIGSEWAGATRPHCGICKELVMYTFVDGRTRNGQWGIMCPTCRIDEGRLTLGEGLGQKYDYIGGKYVRTA